VLLLPCRLLGSACCCLLNKVYDGGCLKSTRNNGAELCILLWLLAAVQALGECLLLPKDCSGAGDQCNAGQCSFLTGLCEKEPANEGEPTNETKPRV
jgi:hypothetical protein